MKLVSDEALRCSILKMFPDFKNLKFKFNHDGWTSIVVDIDGEYICKFPRTEQKLSFLETENVIIGKFIQAFPEIEFPQRTLINSDIPFYMHKKLQGDFITVDKYNKLSHSKQEIFIDEVSSFFAKLHQLPIVEFRNILKRKDEQLPDINTLVDALKTDFSTSEVRKIMKIIDDFSNLSQWSSPVVGYYDFHAHNILFNPHTGKLSGIFDFDEVAIGTAKFDLREIFLNYNQEIGNKVLISYNNKVRYSIPAEVIKTSLIGWSFVEYMNMKQRIMSGELTDVSSVDLSEFKMEIQQMIKTY